MIAGTRSEKNCQQTPVQKSFTGGEALPATRLWRGACDVNCERIGVLSCKMDSWRLIYECFDCDLTLVPKIRPEPGCRGGGGHDHWRNLFPSVVRLLADTYLPSLSLIHLNHHRHHLVHDPAPHQLASSRAFTWFWASSCNLDGCASNSDRKLGRRAFIKNSRKAQHRVDFILILHKYASMINCSLAHPKKTAAHFFKFSSIWGFLFHGGFIKTPTS